MTQQKAIHIQFDRLAEQVGNFIQYWGFKKIHGQVWTHIYLSTEPLSALQLIERLQVSKALISSAIRELIEYQLLIQTPESIDKKNKFYIANPNVFEAIRFVLMTRELHLLKSVSSEHQLLHELMRKQNSPQFDQKRLKQLGKMIDGAETALASLIRLSAINPSFLLAISSALK